jgi:hypothetical protein
VTVHVVDHLRQPSALVPRNFAPTCGFVAPSSQRALVVSGDHSPIRVMSLIIDITSSGGAAMSCGTDTEVDTF